MTVNRLLAGFGLLTAAFLLAASRVHVNASWSDDAWGYLLLPMGKPQVGDIVIFDPPEDLRASAPYLKRVLGVPGDAVDVDGTGEVWLNGEPVARAKPRALDGRVLVPVAPATIPAGHYYLHADHADSHDSRYAEIGLVPRERILGRAVALPDVAWLGLEGPLVKPHVDCGSDRCEPGSAP
ncbi:MAG: signal peptidase I [Rhodospirillaceae bacterium]|nr:signal peptidase I [Rhodospirillaceae bacterium]